MTSRRSTIRRFDKKIENLNLTKVFDDSTTLLDFTCRPVRPYPLARSAPIASQSACWKCNFPTGPSFRPSVDRSEGLFSHIYPFQRIQSPNEYQYSAEVSGGLDEMCVIYKEELRFQRGDGPNFIS